MTQGTCICNCIGFIHTFCQMYTSCFVITLYLFQDLSLFAAPWRQSFINIKKPKEFMNIWSPFLKRYIWEKMMQRRISLNVVQYYLVVNPYQQDRMCAHHRSFESNVLHKLLFGESLYIISTLREDILFWQFSYSS